METQTPARVETLKRSIFFKGMLAYTLLQSIISLWRETAKVKVEVALTWRGWWRARWRWTYRKTLVLNQG